MFTIDIRSCVHGNGELLSVNKSAEVAECVKTNIFVQPTTYCTMPLSTPKHQLARCVKYGPPERSDAELRKLEKSFILDCVFVGTLSDDSGRANPKMATAIPPYNAQKDKFARGYFECPTVQKVLKKTGQDVNQGDSLCGRQMDRFYVTGSMGTNIHLRNQNGAGNCQEVIRGHSMFMENPKPIIGYHGLYGFRRNTPWLRQKPSVFIGKLDNRSLVP